MDPSEEQGPNLTALLAAAENADVASTTEIWRGMNPMEQEGVLLTLLGLPGEQADQTVSIGLGLDHVGEKAAVQADQTELIPKAVEDLRGLTASDNDAGGAVERPAMAIGSTDYWARWRQRWKWSVLVTVWAMATIFAFNGKFDSFGPMEWVVSTFVSVILSGLLIGTVADFLVALIPRTSPTAREQLDH
jgi:hypothetical protein